MIALFHRHRWGLLYATVDGALKRCERCGRIERVTDADWAEEWARLVRVDGHHYIGRDT